LFAFAPKWTQTHLLISTLSVFNICVVVLWEEKAMLKSIAVSLVQALRGGFPATGWGYERALAAAKRGDYTAALKLWPPLAEQGNPRAQNDLAIMCHRGLGVPQDYAKAANWYRKAAEQGFAAAQYELGAMYERGQGVPQDNVEAAKWFRKAATHKSAPATHSLGHMYY
jgi:hypothetical protein